MNATFSRTGLAQTTGSTRRVFCLFRGYWGAIQEWRKRERLRADLYGLDDRELQDIGIARGEIGYVVSKQESIRPDRSKRRHSGGILIVLIFCSLFILVFTSEARAQCTAQDVLQNRLALKQAPSGRKPQNLVKSAVDFPVWKKIAVGTFSDSLALRRALHAIGCGVIDTAAEILARPAFTLSATTTDVELFAISVAELGFQTETASLGQIYARAQQLGFGLAAAEIGPQLRLQYLDQPIGEFLIIGMEPIETWNGEPVILNVANGGAGLILIGQDGRFAAEIFAASRFLFVRNDRAAPTEAALVHR